MSGNLDDPFIHKIFFTSNNSLFANAMKKLLEKVYDLFFCLNEKFMGFYDIKPKYFLLKFKQDYLQIGCCDYNSIFYIDSPISENIKKNKTYLMHSSSNSNSTDYFNKRHNTYNFGLMVFYFFVFLPYCKSKLPNIIDVNKYYDFIVDRNIFYNVTIIYHIKSGKQCKNNIRNCDDEYIKKIKSKNININVISMLFDTFKFYDDIPTNFFEKKISFNFSVSYDELVDLASLIIDK